MGIDVLGTLIPKKMTFLPPDSDDWSVNSATEALPRKCQESQGRVGSGG